MGLSEFEEVSKRVVGHVVGYKVSTEPRIDCKSWSAMSLLITCCLSFSKRGGQGLRTISEILPVVARDVLVERIDKHPRRRCRRLRSKGMAGCRGTDELCVTARYGGRMIMRKVKLRLGI